MTAHVLNLPSAHDFYLIIRVEKHKWRTNPCAHIALFDEVSTSSLGRVLNKVPPEQIVAFMAKFKSISIYLDRNSFDVNAYRWKLPMEKYSEMVVITDEAGFQAWKDFSQYVFKAHERGAAVHFSRGLK